LFLFLFLLANKLFATASCVLVAIAMTSLSAPTSTTNVRLRAVNDYLLVAASSLPAPILTIIVDYFRECDRLLLIGNYHCDESTPITKAAMTTNRLAARQRFIWQSAIWSLDAHSIRQIIRYFTHHHHTKLKGNGGCDTTVVSVPVPAPMATWQYHRRSGEENNLVSQHVIIPYGNGTATPRLTHLVDSTPGSDDGIARDCYFMSWNINEQILHHPTCTSPTPSSSSSIYDVLNKDTDTDL
jgi:hypothetical protein